MDMKILGKTGLKVSRLGLGLPGEEQVGRLLNAALDSDINFLDTACYGNSEELLGRTIAHRRKEYVLATKVVNRVDGSDQAGDFSPI